MNNTTASDTQIAVIYCRVSSVAQLRKGDGLASQETRCREYARFKNYEVVEVFHDNKTGGIAERPAMTALLAFLQKNKEECVVIIDDINRFSRDVVVHWQLRALLAEAGGKLESPSIEFGEDSDSILIENLLASVSQHQRQKNGEQTKNRMRARALNGYWVFHAPPGYRYKQVQGHGNLMVRDEPLASIIQEALEGFATGRFETQAEVKRFLENQSAFPKDCKDGSIRFEKVNRLMNRIHYAGYVEIPDWGVTLRKGHHEGLISLETYHTIQERIKTGAKAPARKDISSDFPLRGFVLCNDCHKPLTACWSTSKTGKKHPYYLCPTKGCASYRKSIRRDQLEGDFDDLIQNLQPTESLFQLAKAMFKDAWGQRASQTESHAKTIKKDIRVLEKQIEALLDRVVEASNTSIIQAYEKRLSKLEKDKQVLAEKLEKGSKPARGFDEMFELALRFLSNPWNLWKSDDLHHKRLVLRLAFSERIRYCRSQGLRTPKMTLPFNMLGGLHMGKCEMAEREGFEPSRRLPAYTLSRRAPSTTRPPLHFRRAFGCLFLTPDAH